MQHLRVLLEQVVRHVRDGALRTSGLGLVRNAEREHHLALPQRDGVHNGGLDLLDKRNLVVLHEANLRRRLHGDGAGEVQIAKLLLEARAHGLEVLRSLGVLGAAGGAGVLDKLDELAFANLRELLFARKQIHRELLEVREVQLVHLVERRRVLHERHLVVLQLVDNLVHVRLGLVVARPKRLHLVDTALEEAEQPLLLGGVEPAQLVDNAGDKIAHLAQIVRAHPLERRLGEIGHLLLRAGAVLHDGGRVAHIDLLGERFNHLFLVIGEHGVVECEVAFAFRQLLHRLGGENRSGRIVELGSKRKRELGRCLRFGAIFHDDTFLRFLTGACSPVFGRGLAIGPCQTGFR